MENEEMMNVVEENVEDVVSDNKDLATEIIDGIKKENFKTGLIAGATVLATGGLAFVGYKLYKKIRSKIAEKNTAEEENVEE